MYIEPNSDIVILRNVPLDPTYDHTIYWNPTSGAGGATAQRDYFLSKRKGYNSQMPSVPGRYWLSAQSYQRVKRGYIRCELLADELYDCNYLMFQNTSFGSKWFYAFIRNVEYINNKVSEIQFELDVMQTWHFDYELEDCFVEREHSATDEIGENTLPENLEIGDYVYIDAGNSFNNSNVPSDYDPSPLLPPAEYPSDFCVCICAPFKIFILNDEPLFAVDNIPGFYNGIFSGLYYNIFNLDTLDDWDTLIHYLSEGTPGDGRMHLPENRREEIVGIYMMPKYLVSEWSKYPNTSAMGIGVFRKKYYDWTKDADNTTIQSYVPKNKKLYTYPYNALYVTSSDGDSAYFKYELFSSSSNCNFSLEGAMGVPPEIGLTPVGYCFPADPAKKNYNFTLAVKNIPMCSWTTDTFKAWLAQNSVSLITRMGTAIAGYYATGGVITATANASPWMTQAIADARQTQNQISAAGGVANTLAQIHSAALQPDHSHGVTKAMLGFANNEFGYHYYYARIKDEFARVIDEYFSRYGYATKRNKKPNRTARPHWTYTKTIGCTIVASIPTTDSKKICDIYNNGITFWKNGDEIGNYSLDNAPATQQTVTP